MKVGNKFGATKMNLLNYRVKRGVKLKVIKRNRWLSRNILRWKPGQLNKEW